MKFTLAFGVVAALFSQGGLADKCPQPPAYSQAPVVSTPVSSAAISSAPVGPYSTLPMPSDFTLTPISYSSVQQYSTSVPQGPYSTRPMPSSYHQVISSPVFSTALMSVPTATPVFSTAPMPVPTVTPPVSPPSGAYQITQNQLNAAIPDRAGDNSCTAAPAAGECATNTQALAAINNALTKYGITKRGEAVAVIALMAYESANWAYNINHFPGRPGQGTRAMLMYNFVEKYAQSLHSAETAQALAGSGSATDIQNSVRALVLNNNDSFGSGFWYLTTQASAYHNSAGKLRDGNVADFEDYIVNGVGAGWSSDRQTTWAAVNAAIPV